MTLPLKTKPPLQGSFIHEVGRDFSTRIRVSELVDDKLHYISDDSHYIVDNMIIA